MTLMLELWRHVRTTAWKQIVSQYHPHLTLQGYNNKCSLCKDALLNTFLCARASKMQRPWWISLTHIHCPRWWPGLEAEPSQCSSRFWHDVDPNTSCKHCAHDLAKCLVSGIVVANIPAPQITHIHGIAACSRRYAHGSAGNDVVIAASFDVQNVYAYIALSSYPHFT